MTVHDEIADGIEEEIETIKRSLDCIQRCLSDKTLVSQLTYERFKQYPLANIQCALDNDHDWLGGCMYTLQDIADEIREEKESEDEDDDGDE